MSLCFTAWRVRKNKKGGSQGTCLLCWVYYWAIRKSEEPATCARLTVGLNVSVHPQKERIETLECLWNILNPGLWVTPGAFGLSKTKSKSCGSSRERQMSKDETFWRDGKCWWQDGKCGPTKLEHWEGGAVRWRLAPRLKWRLGWRCFSWWHSLYSCQSLICLSVCHFKVSQNYLRFCLDLKNFKLCRKEK